MRLLHTSTLELVEFFGDKTPPYAILSHRWEDEEVTFQDMIGGKTIAKNIGYSKIKGCCNKAIKDHWDWVWIDSCCIDKTSSTELSEAINSMFKWYQNASVCYAYLSDVRGRVNQNGTLLNTLPFRNSKWFSRGWTLQELLAPSDVVFFDSKWKMIGRKSGLQKVLSLATGIKDLRNFDEASIAQKMSWVSRRETTRVEDMAYCMLGLFGIHMPPLYGEGQNAFIRLQLEILKISDDESIFAWKASPGVACEHPERGLLAWLPSEFSECGDIQRLDFGTTQPFSMTNKGLSIKLPMQLRNYDGIECVNPYLYYASLDCRRASEESRLQIVLKQDYKNDVITRVFPDFHANEEPLGNFLINRQKEGSETFRTPLDDQESIFVREPKIFSGSNFGPDRYLKVILAPGDFRILLGEIFTSNPWDYWLEEEPYVFKMCLGVAGPAAFIFREPVALPHKNHSLYQVLVMIDMETQRVRIETIPPETIRTSFEIACLLNKFADEPTLAVDLSNSNLPGWRGVNFPHTTVLIPPWERVLRLEFLKITEHHSLVISSHSLKASADLEAYRNPSPAEAAQ